MKLPVNRRLEDLPVNDFARRIAWHSRGFVKVAKWRTAGNQQVDDHGDNFSDQKLLVSILPFETNDHSVNVLECFELLRGCGCHVARSVDGFRRLGVTLSREFPLIPVRSRGGEG